MCLEMITFAFFWKKYNLPLELLQFKADPVEAYIKALSALGLQRVGLVQNPNPFFLGFHALGCSAPIWSKFNRNLMQASHLCNLKFSSILVHIKNSQTKQVKNI